MSLRTRNALQLLEGVSGVDYISRFDASDFPTKFAAQARHLPPTRHTCRMVPLHAAGAGLAAASPIRFTRLPKRRSASQIKGFDVGDLVDKKNARRYDDCLSYTMVASKKVPHGRSWVAPAWSTADMRAASEVASRGATT